MGTTWLVSNRFEIRDLEQDLLGRGSMGEVYRATDTHTGGTVAIKALDPRVVARDPGILERFVREGEALRQLDHPNIVRMVAAVEEEDATTGVVAHYLVMEYVAGGSLQDLMESQRPDRSGRPVRSLPTPRVLEIALELADALTRAHHLGIIHRDLKPANVLLAEDGTPQLTDFGIAHVAESPRLTETGILVGTPDFLSPEACSGQALDERTDIWAFGVLLFEMLTGETPFRGDNLTAKLTAILTQPVPDLAQRCPDAPEALVDLVYRMLEKDREQRIPSVRLVGAELEAILKDREVPTPVHLAPGESRVAPPTPPVQPPSFLEEEEPVQRPVFVARERELAQLDEYLNTALAGQGRVVFVTGDAGQGKTALVGEFAWRAQAAHPDLVVAGGNCNAHTGIGDPYLPFREILSLLTGDVQDHWAARAMGREQARRLWRILPLAVQALVEAGPDLIDLFVSGAALLQRAEAFTPWPGGADWLPRLEELVQRRAIAPGDPNLQQSALFEQYTRVVGALAGQRPLLLVLDDLQWADGGSISLLFHLGRRIEGRRILIVGAYRPAEVALGRLSASSGQSERHPLEPVVNELTRQYGEIKVDLGETEDWHFVEAFLDSEPNRLGDNFRETLYRRTRGHALSTVELLRDMQERGDLVQDSEGRWVEGQALDWEALPARVEAMIAERIGRLAEPARELLQAASVEGETFTAEVVARALGANEREMVQQLSRLDREHRLVSAQGIRRRDGQSLSRYRFRHILFQRYLYNSLSEAEQVYLHDDVGTALEALYGVGTEEIAAIAPQLARHFQEAETAEKAADYFSQAGDRARRLYAHQEAVDHYQQAIANYQHAFGDRWDTLQWAALERKIGEAWFRQGEHPQALEHLGRALAILGKPLPNSRWEVRLAILGEIVRQIGHRILPGSFFKSIGRSVGPAVEEVCRSWDIIAWIEGYTNPERYLLVTLKAVNTTEHGMSPKWAAISSSGLGLMLDLVPIFWLAEGYHHRGMAYAEQSQDPEAVSHAHLALGLHKTFLGEWDAVIEFAQRAAEIFRDAGDWRKWGFPAYQMFLTRFYQGDLARALAHNRELVRVGQERVDPQVQCWGLSAQGVVQQRLGELDEAIVTLQEAIELAKAIPDHAFRISALADLGRCYLRQGDLEGGLAMLQESQEFYAPYLGGDSYASLRNGLVEAYLLAAEQGDKTERADWLKRARRACKDALRQGKAFRPGLPEAMRLRGTYDCLNGKPGAAQKWWQRSLALAEEMGQRYDLGVTHLEMGQRLGQRVHLERAEIILAEIGAEWDLTRVREAIRVIL